MSVATRGSTLAIGYSFPIIGLLVVAARLASRHRNKAPIKLDDYLCVAAWVFVTGACATLLVGIYHNAFFISNTAGPEGLEKQGHILAQVLASFVVLYTCANTSIKLSILFYYRRIFSIGHGFSICSWILIFASCVWFVYSIVAWLLYCGTHVREDFEGPFTVCPVWGVDLEQAAFVFDSIIDFLILILPIPMVWRLQLNMGRKILVVLLFCLGGFAFVAGLNNTVVQLIYVVDPTNSGVEGASPDFAQGGDLILSNWPAIEIGVGLIASCLPSISMHFIRRVSEMVVQGWTSISDRASRMRSGSNISAEREGTAASSSMHHVRRDDARPDSTDDHEDIHLAVLSKSKVVQYKVPVPTEADHGTDDHHTEAQETV